MIPPTSGEPRLPPVGRPSRPDPPSDDRSRSPADLGAVDRTGDVVRRMTWTDYSEPELLRLRVAGRLVLGSRIVLAAWAMSVVVVAVLLRSDSAEGSVSTAPLSRLGLAGALAAGVAAASGWYWTDRTTQNVHRLGARFPSRRRCATAWAWPLVWVLVLSLTVLRLDQTELVDLRPGLAGIVFALALWRPYSLVRRILKSLIRVDSDLAVASGYLLDAALFGLMWARIASVPAELGPSDDWIVGGLLGLGAVAAIAALGNVGVWFLLVRDVSRAVEHRRVAMRTRHEHRQLRLVGIDPLDPQVRLALHLIRQDEHRAEAARTDAGVEPGGALDPRLAAPRREQPPVVGAEPGDTVGADVPEAVAASPRNEDPIDEDVASPRVDDRAATRDPLGRIETRLQPEPRPREVETVADGDEPGLATADDEADVTDASDVADHAASATAEPIERGGARDGRGRGLPASLGHAAGRSHRASTIGRRQPAQARLDRLSARLSEVSPSGGEPSAPERRDRLARRLGTAPSDEPSILERLERYGIAPGDTVIPDDGVSRVSPDDRVADRALTIDRLYGLESVRYLLVLAAVVCAGASAWFVARSVDVGALVDGRIAASELDRLDVARLAAVHSLAVTLALVPLWCAVAARWANRVGIDVPGVVRCTVLTVVSAGFLALGIVADQATNVLLVSIVGCLGAALWSVPVMVQIERGFARGTIIPSLLPAALAVAVATAWIGRLLRPVEVTDSLEAMTFVGGLLALTVAIAAVVAAVATGDVVEAIKLSPAAAGRSRAASADDD